MRTVLIATALAGWSMWCLAAQAPEAGAQAAQQPAASPAPQNPPADANARPAAGAAIDPAKMAAPAATKAAPPSSKVYVIGAEDVLKIVIWNNAPMSGEFPVRPDGAISIPVSYTHLDVYKRQALVNAPLVWPNRVDSSRSGGSWPLLTATNNWSARGELA